MLEQIIRSLAYPAIDAKMALQIPVLKSWVQSIAKGSWPNAGVQFCDVVTRKLTVALYQPMPGLEEPDRKRLLPVCVSCGHLSSGHNANLGSEHTSATLPVIRPQIRLQRSVFLYALISLLDSVNGEGHRSILVSARLTQYPPDKSQHVLQCICCIGPHHLPLRHGTQPGDLAFGQLAGGDDA